MIDFKKIKDMITAKIQPPKPEDIDKHLIEKVQQQTGLEPAKVKQIHKKWLSMPENRTKYKSIKDAPKVVFEEVLAMATDIADFAEGEEMGHSIMFERIKEQIASFKESPKVYVAKQITKTIDLAKLSATAGRAALERAEKFSQKVKAIKLADTTPEPEEKEEVK
jgi:hypothetical protein